MADRVHKLQPELTDSIRFTPKIKGGRTAQDHPGPIRSNSPIIDKIERMKRESASPKPNSTTSGVSREGSTKQSSVSELTNSNFFEKR